MCGIAGFIEVGPGDAGVLQEHARSMADRIRHRGPDDDGIWVEPSLGVALAHRRLSVLDLSPQGKQPMLSASGRYVVVFNGEIYNYQELRAELSAANAAPAWRGHSDTEVMLAAFEHWGVQGALQRLNGMFALALWDRREQVLHLARDRMGEKPLYYGWFGSTLLFGSELKALRAHPAWKGEIDRDALALLMRHNAIPGPYTIYRGVNKLPPASWISFRRSGADQGREARPKLYWDFRHAVEAGQRAPFGGSEPEAVEALDVLLRDAVKLRMEADVPLGAFLSGGVDSSVVVALMQAQSSRPVKTFSIGFHEQGFNEAHHAKGVAAHLGTEHTELYVTSEEAMAVVPKLPTMYDEPFADSSQIPTFLVSQLARRQVTVSLSGDGGDELFGGYTRYFLAGNIWRKVSWLPRPLRMLAAGTIRQFSQRSLDAVAHSVRGITPSSLRIPMLGDKLHKGADLLASHNAEELYRELVSHWKNPGELVLGASEPPTVLTDSSRQPATADLISGMMALDTLSYLPDDILTKVDRATMAVSLEGRIPLLDHRVVEHAWQLPLAMKVRGGVGKWILRQVLDRYVPKELIERPKMGFGVPIDVWLRGPLREWAEELLGESRLRREGFFDPAPIREKWQQHQEGTRNWQYHLWDVLMFQAWLEAQ